MGKSTAAAMFGDFGAAVFDADYCVHNLYNGDKVKLVENSFPGITREGRVDRSRLGAIVFEDPKAMARLERIVHPFVVEERRSFLRNMRAAGVRLAVLDVPLLLETRAEEEVDAVVVVTAGSAVQRERVLSRNGMNEAKFAAILERQMPDVEKRRRAHFIVRTCDGFASARRQIRTIIAASRNCERIY
jgi:dephospho-CoA kinase